jgi:hypothetical protein
VRNGHSVVAAATGLIFALAGAIPSSAAAQRLSESDAARTSLVLVPGVGMDPGLTGKGWNLFFGLGGRVDWLPRIPVLVTAGGYTEIAGRSGWHSYEVGGGWRYSQSTREGYESVVTNVQQIAHGDSVRTTYLEDVTGVRRYSVLRAGLLHNQSVTLLGPPTVAISSFYVGWSRNKLVNQEGGVMGHAVIQTTSLDLLFGSPPSGAPKSTKIGARVSYNMDYGNRFDMRLEGGLRPGLGVYGQVSINGYFMFKDILR